MSGKESILKTVKGIRGAIGNIQLNHQRLGDDIQYLIEETEKLIADLELNQGKKKETRIVEKKVPIEVCRGLLNHQVRVVNPPKGDTGYGTIRSVGSYFVTVVLSSNGSQIKRAAKNIRILERV